MAGSWGGEPGSALAAGFAERLLEVIDSGRRTATYKLALLMALLDLCARRGGLGGRAPDVLYTREIAERVAAIYWPQLTPYRRGPAVIELRQITAPRSAITGAVLEFRRAAGAPFHGAPEAGHFIPRVRCGIDAVENLVLTDRSCNNDKRDLLPAPPLVDAWAGRNREHQATLASLASVCGWESDPEGTLAVARSIYRHLPAGPAPFWRGTGQVDITHGRPGIVIEII